MAFVFEFQTLSLINFTKIYQLKGLDSKKQMPHKLLWMSSFDEKVYLRYYYYPCLMKQLTPIIPDTLMEVLTLRNYVIFTCVFGGLLEQKFLLIRSYFLAQFFLSLLSSKLEKERIHLLWLLKNSTYRWGKKIHSC